MRVMTLTFDLLIPNKHFRGLIMEHFYVKFGDSTSNEHSNGATAKNGNLFQKYRPVKIIYN